MLGQVEWTVRGKQWYPLGLCSHVSTIAVAHPVHLLELILRQLQLVCEWYWSCLALLHTVFAKWVAHIPLVLHCHRTVTPLERNSQEPRHGTVFVNDEHSLTHLVIEPRGKLTVSWPLKNIIHPDHYPALVTISRQGQQARVVNGCLEFEIKQMRGETLKPISPRLLQSIESPLKLANESGCPFGATLAGPCKSLLE